LKLTEKSIALWANVLHAVPEGKLLLKTKLLEDIGNQRRVWASFARHGVLAERVVLEGESSWDDYMEAYNRIDIALDPVGGHSGGTISCDALWMGVAVVHASGSEVTSRFTESILTALGRTEWVCATEEAYIAKAVALARDPDARQAIRSQLREQFLKSPLGDAKGLARHLEDAYFSMFDRWQDKQNDSVVVDGATP
jgi:predicted O-linked N-acetylglucosamine transferase (SPINDLY family)